MPKPFHSTARALRDLFAAIGNLFDRDMPGQAGSTRDGRPTMASPLTVSGVVIETHRLRQPVKLNSEGQPTPITLPERVAKMYLEMRGECNLPALTGIATTPCFQRVELFGTSLDMTGKVGFGVPRCRR